MYVCVFVCCAHADMNLCELCDISHLNLEELCD